MARKSRVNVENKPTEPAPYYRVGVYARVSKEENQYSNTIVAQDGMGKEFIAGHRDMQYIKCYSDINVSSFVSMRPAFEEMIADIQAGKINCVIVKDISRFGRNYIQTMEYISEAFPRMGVRFVSLTEGYDSINDVTNYNFSLPLRSIVNYYYSVDLSQKVKATVSLKQKNGTYLPPAFPFGYQKKYIGHDVMLEVNEVEADTVQRVFQAHAEGVTIYAIVKKLNEENQHNRSWTQSFVSRMLKNPFYKGTYLAGKTKKLFNSSLVFRNPMDSWIKIENHHEAIITADLFDKVQKRFPNEKKITHTTQRKHDFSGKVYCEYCGKKMRRIVQRTSAGNETASYVCSTHLGSAGVLCKRNAISEKKLKAEVLRQMASRVEDVKQLQLQRQQYEESFAFQEWLQFRQSQMKKLEKRILELENIDFTIEIYEFAKDNKGYYHADYVHISQLRADEKKYLNEQLFQIKDEIDEYWKRGSSKAEELQRVLEWEEHSFSENEIPIPYIKNIDISNLNVLMRLF